MIWLTVICALLIINAAFGVFDVKNNNTTKSAAFTWFATGWVAFHFVLQLILVFGGH